MKLENVISEFKTHLGNEMVEKIIKEKILGIDDTMLTIELKQNLQSKLYDARFEIEIYSDETYALVNIFYLSFTGDLGKVNIIYYDDDNNMLIVDEDRIEIKENEIYIDGQHVDFNSENCIYEIDREESFNNSTYFDINDFNYFLNNYPFSKKIEEDDGTYYLKSMKVNKKNILLLSNWLRPLLNELTV